MPRICFSAHFVVHAVVLLLATSAPAALSFDINYIDCDNIEERAASDLVHLIIGHLDRRCSGQCRNGQTEGHD